jgi:hypothetical protein
MQKLLLHSRRHSSAVLAVLLILFSFHAEGKEIDLSTSFRIVGKLFATENSLRSLSESDIRLVHTGTLDGGDELRSAASQPAYYVYNVGENQGWAIISADDYLYPVIGYSLTGSYDAENLPPAFKSWMKGICADIVLAREKNLRPPKDVINRWMIYLSDRNLPLRASSGTVLLKTKWNQDSPYNDLCPYYSGTKRAVTGCVATATAQIMKYHGHPAKGSGTTAAYNTKTKNIPVPAITLSDYSYSWSSMIESYSGGAGTVTQRTEVAKLMYHIGASVEMDYDEESGASNAMAAISLVNHFSYDKSIVEKRREFYTDTEWKQMITEEIQADRPILFQGVKTDDSGHSFVLDGYNSTMFHFNWGWGGYQDGWFAMNNPNSYINDHAIIMNIKPNAGGTKSYEFGIPDDNTFANAETGEPVKVTPFSAPSRVEVGTKFEVNCPFLNLSLFGVEGTAIYAIALASSMNVTDYVALLDYGTFEKDMGYGSGYSRCTFNDCSVPASVQAGNYVIIPIVIPDPGKMHSFVRVRPMNSNPGSIAITVTNASTPTATLTISPSSLSFDSSASSRTVTIASNTSWKATSSATWLTLTPASGTGNATLTAKATANTSTSARTATITITGGGITRTATVTQSGSISYNSDFVVENGVLVKYNGNSSVVNIPGNLGIKEIGDDVFYENETIITVIIPEGVTKIGKWAFAASTVRSVTLPYGLKTIADYAFFLSDFLTLDIPSTVTTIGADAIMSSYQSTITVRWQTPISVTESDFDYWHEEDELRVPTGKRSAYQSANFWKYFGSITADITAIEPIEQEYISAKVFFRDDHLVISSPVRESIEVYSVTGATILKAVKPAGESVYRIDSPERIFLIRGSSGWTRRVAR